MESRIDKDIKQAPPSPRSPSEHVEDVRTLFRDAIPTYFDPLFLDRNASVIPEHEAVAELLDCALTMVRAIENLKEKNGLKKKNLVKNIHVINSALNKIEKVMGNLEKSPSFSKYLSMLNQFFGECQVYFSSHRQSFRHMVNRALESEGQLFEFQKTLITFINRYTNKSQQSAAYQLWNDLGGVSGVYHLKQYMQSPSAPSLPATEVLDSVSAALLDPNEPAKKLIRAINAVIKNKSITDAEDLFLEDLKQRNQVLKRLMLAIDELEVGVGFREGAILEMVNRIIRGKNKNSTFDIKKLISDINEGMHKLGYKFDSQDQYPYSIAILEQRKKQLEKEEKTAPQLRSQTYDLSIRLMRARVNSAAKRVDDDNSNAILDFKSNQRKILNAILDHAVNSLSTCIIKEPGNIILGQQFNLLISLREELNNKYKVIDAFENGLDRAKKLAHKNMPYSDDFFTIIRQLERALLVGTIRHTFVLYVDDRISWYRQHQESYGHYMLQMKRLTEFREILEKWKGISVKNALKRMRKDDANLLEKQESVLLLNLRKLERFIPPGQEKLIIIPGVITVKDQQQEDKRVEIVLPRRPAEVKRTYRDVINASIDPLFKDEKGQSILSEHRQITKLLDSVQAVLPSALSVGFVQIAEIADEKPVQQKGWMLPGFLSGAANSIWGVANSVTGNIPRRAMAAVRHSSGIKESLKELQDNPGVMDVLSSLSSVVDIYHQSFGQAKEWLRDNADDVVDFTKLLAKDIQNGMKRIDHFINVVEQNGAYRAYKLLGGIEGIGKILSVIRGLTADLAEISKKAIVQVNQLLKRLLIAIDEMEMSMGFVEGAGLEFINLFLNKDVVNEKERIDIRELINRITMRMNLLGYEFDPMNRYPYIPAILAQRKVLYKKAEMIANPVVCKDMLETLTHNSESLENNELFRQLPLIVSYYRVDKKILEAYKSAYETAWKCDFKDVAALTRARVALADELHKKPGSVLTDEVRAKKVALASSRVESAKKRCENEVKNISQLRENNKYARLIHLISLRVLALDNELKKVWFFKHAKLQKIQLLAELKIQLSKESAAAQPNYLKVISDFRLDKSKALLFERGSRSADVMDDLSLLSNQSLQDVYKAKIDTEIERLNASINGGFIFFNDSRVAVLKKTRSILLDLKVYMVDNQGWDIDTALGCLKPSDVEFIKKQENTLLTKLRQLDIDLPATIKDRRILKV